MADCFRCERNDREVKLNDAIYGNDLVKVCERCALTESIPILKKPSTSQLKAAERSQGVYERLSRLSGHQEKERIHETVLDKIKKLDDYPEIEKPGQRHFNLIHNYHWRVARARRNRGLSQKQLAWALGESETAIKMVEKGDLPEEPETLIRKLEQFFQIHLRERTQEELELERRKKEELQMPKAEIVSEPIQPIIEEEINENDLIKVEKEEYGEELKGPAHILKFKPELMENITIADLKRLKEEQEAEEKFEEEKKEEMKKKEMREKVGQEMKDLALGNIKDSISEKREMLNRAMQRANKEEKEDVPTIQDLMEKKKSKERFMIEEGKMRIKNMERKSEQEQIKRALRGDKEPLKEENKPAELEVTASELLEGKKEKEESLLGEDIEIIEE